MNSSAYEGFPGADEENGGFPGQNAYEADRPKQSVTKQPLVSRAPVADPFAEQGFPGQESFPGEEPKQAAKKQEVKAPEKQKQEKKSAPAKKSAPGEKNWPFPCLAITYHSISDEIPPHCHTMVRQFYGLWMWTCICLIWNWITVVSWAGKQVVGHIGAIEAILASVYVALGIPGSWKFWYRTLYYSTKGKGSARWCCFTVFFWGHILFCIACAIGVGQAGMAGFISMVEVYAAHDKMLGTFGLAAGVAWVLNALAGFYLVKRAHTTWKEGGGEAQAKREVGKAVVKAAVSQQQFPGQENFEDKGKKGKKAKKEAVPASDPNDLGGFDGAGGWGN